jgi:DNA polymerase elongation subunit (family B)
MKYCKIDPSNASRDEIAAEINRLTLLMNLKKNEEQAIKIFINSIYGATASPYFVGYNVRVAEAITLQGQEVRDYGSKIFNRYFTEFWHRDKELHNILGITRVEQIKDEVTVYGDTDSVYITFENLVKGCDWDKDPRQLLLQIYKHRLKNYIEKSYAAYAAQTGTENIQDLEMETISYSAIFLKKKKYCLDLAWKDGEGGGIYYEQQKKIKAVGVEIVQSSTPAFARTKMKELLKIIFQERGKLNLRKFADLLKKEKDSFMLDNIENVSMSSSISDYEKGIGDDRKTLIINAHCPMHVRAAGYHNFLLNSSKWKQKYQLIKSGDKIRYYYAKTDRGVGENVFGYLPGNYPIELAPAVDYDMQFSKCIIDPLNRFISAIGLPPISSELIVRTQLF